MTITSMRNTIINDILIKFNSLTTDVLFNKECLLSIYYIIFEILTENNTKKNYSSNSNSILFNLNSCNISIETLANVSERLDNFIHSKNENIKIEDQRLFKIEKMRETILKYDSYKKDLSDFIKTNQNKITYSSLCNNSSADIDSNNDELDNLSIYSDKSVKSDDSSCNDTVDGYSDDYN